MRLYNTPPSLLLVFQTKRLISMALGHRKSVNATCVPMLIWRQIYGKETKYRTAKFEARLHPGALILSHLSNALGSKYNVHVHVHVCTYASEKRTTSLSVGMSALAAMSGAVRALIMAPATA